MLASRPLVKVTSNSLPWCRVGRNFGPYGEHLTECSGKARAKPGKRPIGWRSGPELRAIGRGLALGIGNSITRLSW